MNNTDIVEPENFVRACQERQAHCTRSMHPHYTPSWLRYSENKKSDYQEHRQFLRELHKISQVDHLIEEEMRSHLAGFYDCSGNWFCGFCGCWPVEFMDCGRLLGYSNLHDLVAQVETRNVTGYEGYLEIVTRSSVVLIEDGVRAMKSVLRKQVAA